MGKFKRLLRYDWPMHLVLLFTSWLPDNLFFIRFRGYLAHFFLLKGGKNLQIGRDVTFYNPSKIEIGNNVYIAKGCWFSAGGGIQIENNILFGPYVVVVTSNHSMKDGAYYFGKPVDVAPVQIKSGSWIGGHCVLLSGSIVEESCLIAASSVFKGNSEKKGIYAGQPAKLIKFAE